MGKLFDKPLPDLREAFVCARFAERNVFGREDIETWLEGQRRTQDPDEEIWGKLIERRHMRSWADRDFFDLRSHATSLGVLNKDLGSMGEANAYGPIFDLMAFNARGLDPERGLYSSNGNGLLYVVDHIYGPLFVVREKTDESLTIVRVRDRKHALAAKAILGAVFAEWNQHRPKRETARDSLCVALTDEIEREREAAQRDFDEAVAVSANGTEIVKATWVFVAEGNTPTSGLLFPASAFRQSKILCGTTIGHVDVERWMLEQISLDRRELSLDRFLSYMFEGWGRSWVVSGACLVSDNKCRDILQPGETILLVNKNNCPSPLPDGGREIRIDDK